MVYTTYSIINLQIKKKVICLQNLQKKVRMSWLRLAPIQAIALLESS